MMFFERDDATRVARILSVDGGGIRGLIPAVVLSVLEARLGKPVSELFHMISGTSTGAVLGLGLTMERPYTGQQMVGLYEENGPRIFRSTPWRKIKTANGMTGPYYDAASWEGVLRDTMGDRLFSACRNDTIVAAYDLEKRKPSLFKSWLTRPRDASADDHTRGHDYLIRDLARGSSAAPTYFEPAKIRGANSRSAEAGVCTLIDGGVYANNPAALAISTASRLYPNADSYLLLSLGTGTTARPYSYEQARGWGRPQWAMPVINILSGAVDDTVDYQLGSVLDPGRYFRFQTDLIRRVRGRPAPNDNMDDVSPENLNKLKERAGLMLLEQQPRFDALITALQYPLIDRNELI